MMQLRVSARAVLGHNDALFATKRRLGHERLMPTLFRFLMILGVIAGVVTGSLYVLAEYFQPEPKEITKALRNVKGRLDDTTASTPASSADAGTAAPGEPISGQSTGRRAQ
jgi:hypothetical protein